MLPEFEFVATNNEQVASALSVRNTPKGKTTSCPILPCSVIKYIFNFCPWHWFEGVPQEADDKKHSKLYRLGQGLARSNISSSFMV